jgi:hypothetical protein
MALGDLVLFRRMGGRTLFKYQFLRPQRTKGLGDDPSCLPLLYAIRMTMNPLTASMIIDYSSGQLSRCKKPHDGLCPNMCGCPGI